MKHTGVYSHVSNNTKKEDIEDYDVDHVINDVIKSADNILDDADLGYNQFKNERIIVKALIEHLLEKL